MLSRTQEPGMMMTSVSDAEFNDIQTMIDAAYGHFDASQKVKVILAAARSGSKSEVVSLHREGWHQPESLYNAWWKHITIGYCGGTKIHCYSRLANKTQYPTSATHRIDSISYDGGYGEVTYQ